MAKFRMLAITTALAISCMPLAACVETQPDVTFSDMEVSVEKDGWPGARGAMFEVKGSVTNTSANPISLDSLPILVEGEGEENPPRITQEQLLAGESCDVAYEGTVSIKDGKPDTIEFKGDKTFTGLDEVIKELNDGFASVADEYKEIDEQGDDAEEDENIVQFSPDQFESVYDLKGKTAGEALDACVKNGFIYQFLDSSGADVTDEVTNAGAGSEILQSKVTNMSVMELRVKFTIDYASHAQAGSQQTTSGTERDQALRDVADCTGKTAAEALELAKRAGMSAAFVDSYGVNVTRSVEGGAAGSEACEATVARVEMNDGWLYAVPSVVFTLDYIDPDAAARRGGTWERDQERARRVFAGSIGKTAAEAIELAESEGIPYTLIDSWNTDITEIAMEEPYEKWRSYAMVSQVDVSTSGVRFRLDLPLTITAEESPEFAELLELTDPEDEKCATFVSKYQGQVIEFDGCVLDVAKHGDYDTRYDYRLGAGDYADANRRGPSFMFEDVSYYDLAPKGDFPDSVDVGLNLHICAEIVGYDESDGTIALRPVQTRIR